MSWSEVLSGMGGWDGGVRTIVALGLAGTFEDGHGDVMPGQSLEGFSRDTGYGRNGCVLCAGYWVAGTVECGCRCSDSYLGSERRASTLSPSPSPSLPCTDRAVAVASSRILVLRAETTHMNITISITNKVRVTGHNYVTGSV